MPPFSRPFRPGPHAATMAGVLHSLSRHHYSNYLMYSQSLWYPMVPSCQKSLASFTAFETGCTSHHYASVIILISARNPMQSRKCPQMDLAAFSAFPQPIITVSSTFSTSIVTQNLSIQMLEAQAATWPLESLEFVPASHITSMQGPTVLLDRNFPGVAVLQVEQLSGPIRRLRGATLVVQVKAYLDEEALETPRPSTYCHHRIHRKVIMTTTIYLLSSSYTPKGHNDHLMMIRQHYIFFPGFLKFPENSMLPIFPSVPLSLSCILIPPS